MRPGARLRTSSVARRTLSASGWRVLPKLENESMATRGSTSKRRAMAAVSMAISARASAVGSVWRGGWDGVGGATGFVRQRMACAAEVGEREHGHARFDLEAAGDGGRLDGDLRQVL